METGPYLRHRGSKPFYELFVDARGWAGSSTSRQGGEDETMRRVGLKPDGPPRCALVLASANIHAGSGVRGDDAHAGRMGGRLSRRVRNADGIPSPRDSKDDPKPNMPGWAWLERVDAR